MNEVIVSQWTSCYFYVILEKKNIHHLKFKVNIIDKNNFLSKCNVSKFLKMSFP